jgi:uncharacterized SAM-binding protein YcdF (DUF218 family)
MTFFLSKLLPLFVYPAGFACILLIIALIWWKKRRFARWMVFLSLLIIFVAGNRWISMALVRSLERQHPVADQDIKADVIVVLGGGTDPWLAPRQMVEVNGAGDRVIYALKLYKEDAADKILLSGGTIEWQNSDPTSPAEDMADLLMLMGVPQEALVEQGISLNTAEDARFSAKIIQQNGWKRVILVTSAMHMPRSVRLFTAEGIEVIPAPVDFTMSDQEINDLYSWRLENVLINILPTSSNLKSTTSAMKEYIGMLVNSISTVE